MSTLAERMPYTFDLPNALGTGMIISSSKAISSTTAAGIRSFVAHYEAALSRFRQDSIVGSMNRAAHGGQFDFPDWCAGLFDLYDQLVTATDGAIDPCVGEDLIRLGYDAKLTFTMQPGAANQLGALHGRPTWRNDVTRQSEHGTTLITHRPVYLDFGACGKGYCVDLIAQRLRAANYREFVINAGGDLRIHSAEPITIALEDPRNTANAVGIARITTGAFCASAPSRRHWQDAEAHELHHLLNAIDGRPVHDVHATWVYTPVETLSTASTTETSQHNGSSNITHYPTAMADGLATALFVAHPNQLAAAFPDGSFACALLCADNTAAASKRFPGEFFTH